MLSGALIPDATAVGVATRTFFGDGFNVEGESEWRSFTHKAATVPESGGGALVMLGMVGVLIPTHRMIW